MEKPHNPSVLRSAAMMSAATLLSRILGMIRDMVIAAYFSRMVSDAFVVAFRLPNLFRRILGEGSLAASFVPLYVESLHRDRQTPGADEAGRFSRAVFSMLCVLTATLSVLGTIYMDLIMAHLVGGESYMSVPGKYELTVWLARIMFCYLFLVTTYAFYMSLANAHKVFFLPALAPAGFNVVTIVMSFLPDGRMRGDQLAWGVTVGGVLQLIMALQPLWERRVLPRWTLNWSAPNVSKFFQTVLPSMLGMSVAQLLGILNVNFASRLDQGTHSYIYFADRLVEFPQSLLSVSLGVALLPTLSELWVRGERQKFLDTAQKHVRLLSTLSLPAAVGLYVLAEPIVRVIYGRGQFNEEDVSRTGQVLAIYAIILVVSGLHRVTVPCFYAIKNTWLPAANSAFCLLVHFFVAGWATDHYGLNGLVSATAFTGALNLGILLLSYKIIFGDLGFGSYARSVAWLTPSLVAMGLAALGTDSYLTFLPSLIRLSVSILTAVVVFFGVNKLLKHEEVLEIMTLLLRRFRK